MTLFHIFMFIETMCILKHLGDPIWNILEWLVLSSKQFKPQRHFCCRIKQNSNNFKKLNSESVKICSSLYAQRSYSSILKSTWNRISRVCNFHIVTSVWYKQDIQEDKTQGGILLDHWKVGRAVTNMEDYSDTNRLTWACNDTVVWNGSVMWHFL